MPVPTRHRQHALHSPSTELKDLLYGEGPLCQKCCLKPRVEQGLPKVKLQGGAIPELEHKALAFQRSIEFSVLYVWGPGVCVC